jgi:hypothetical protein
VKVSSTSTMPDSCGRLLAHRGKEPVPRPEAGRFRRR